MSLTLQDLEDHQELLREDQMKRRLRVYIAGPMTFGDKCDNIRQALRIADQLLDLGYIPYCPHLSHFQQLMFPRKYEDWIAFDFEWIPLCDVLLRLPGKSSGADREVAFAKKQGIPVFCLNEPLTQWPLNLFHSWMTQDETSVTDSIARCSHSISG